MSKWFENRIEENKIRKYTTKRLRPNKLENIFRRFSITNWLVFVNVFVFLLINIIGLFSESSLNNIIITFGLVPNALFGSFYIWSLISSMFLHVDFLHLFANMFSLMFIGNFVEKLIGRKRFFWFYMFAGIFAGLFYALLSYTFGSTCIFDFFGFGCLGEKIFFNPIMPAVGASGAIFGILGLLAILTPKNRVFLISGPLIGIVAYAILSEVFPKLSTTFQLILFFYTMISIAGMVSFRSWMFKASLPVEMPFYLLPIFAIVPLIIVGLFVSLPIGNTAHLGGLLAGLIFGVYLKGKYKRKTDMINKMFSR